MNKGTRDSKQRKIIEEYLKENNNHPTATEIFDHVRGKMPNVSMATVYRNLDILARTGKLQRLSIGSKSRFDSTTGWHFHLLCQSCGKIVDIDHPKIPKEYFNIPNGYELKGCNLEIIGICPECNRTMPDTCTDRYSQELLMAMANGNPMSCIQIATSAGRHPQSVNGKLKSLTENGFIVSIEKGIYKITNKGLQCLKEEK